MSATLKLDAETLYGFQGALLSGRYDEPKPTPGFHFELWDMVCSDAKRVAIAAPRHHAKAQSLTSKVLTSTGWTSIGDLKVGDEVIGGSGKPVKVTHLHPINKMDLYRIITRDGKSTLCNLEHLWNVEIPSNNKRVRTISLREILSNWKTERVREDKRPFTEYRYRIPSQSVIEFSEKSLPVDPYTFGAWLGDGHSASSRFTTADPEILEYFPYATEKQSGKYGYVIRGIYPQLKSLGVLNNKHIPHTYLFSSVEQRLALLQGLMDTDGTCHQDGKVAYFCITKPELRDNVIALIRSLGGIAAASEATAFCNGKDCGLYWRISCKLPKSMNPFRLRRKAACWKGSTALHNYIVGIEKETTALGRCISVEGSTYITDDYLLTHNSTAVTHAYILGSVLFKDKQNVMILSDTQEQAEQFLYDIKVELTENQDLIDFFQVGKFDVESKDEIVAEMGVEGHKFRVFAKGTTQSLRGSKWRGKRPDLIVCDDMENDEMVINKERRTKIKKWMLGTLMPILSDTGQIRVVGTILHADGLLESLLQSKYWTSKRYEAHNDDFTEILWEEKWPKAKLLEEKAMYEEQHELEIYLQEYRNIPIDDSVALFRHADFLPLSEELKDEHLEYYVGVDCAISEKTTADFTVFIVVGVNKSGRMRVVDVIRDRMGPLDTVDAFFQIEERYHPNVFIVEDENISKAIGPFIYDQMPRRNQWPNIETMKPTNDKIRRCKGWQARMRAGGVEFDHDAEWFEDYRAELKMFPRGKHDDQVDASSLIGLYLNQIAEADPHNVFDDEDEYDDDEFDDEFNEIFDEDDLSGRYESTGY